MLLDLLDFHLFFRLYIFLYFAKLSHGVRDLKNSLCQDF